MSYLNKVEGYRGDVLINRSVVRRNNFALLEPEGLVKNVIPGFEECDLTILASPPLGATFVDYLLTMRPGGGHPTGFGADGIELFLYVFEGRVRVRCGELAETLAPGGYVYAAPGERLIMANDGSENAFCFLYKRRYQPLAGHTPYSLAGHVDTLPWIDYEGMSHVRIKNFLPAADDPAFDMNFHILAFKPGSGHGYIETHVQEHGAYIYSGQGMYCLDNKWFPVKKGDYIYMGAYCPQACYATGTTDDLAYLYSKDCNRDVSL